MKKHISIHLSSILEERTISVKITASCDMDREILSSNQRYTFVTVTVKPVYYECRKQY